MISFDCSPVRLRRWRPLSRKAHLCKASVIRWQSCVGTKATSFHALNCALITWRTNRLIGRKDPFAYLRERVQWADEGVVRDRLKSHLISFDIVSKAHYDGMEGTALKDKLSRNFNNFLQDRAELVFSAMSKLTDGATPSLDSIWRSHEPSVDTESLVGAT
jgi:hypothetical protein